MSVAVYCFGTNASGKSTLVQTLFKIDPSHETVDLGRVGKSRCGYMWLPGLKTAVVGLYFNKKGEPINCGGCDTLNEKEAYFKALEEIEKLNPPLIWCEGYLMGKYHWNALKGKRKRILVTFDTSLEISFQRIANRSGKTLETLKDRGGNVISKFCQIQSFVSNLLDEDPPDDFYVCKHDQDPLYTVQKLMTLAFIQGAK